MKKLVFVFFVLLLSAYSLIAQVDKTFYKICETEKLLVWTELERDEITVKTLTNDLIIFQSGLAVYSAKKVPDFNFLELKLDCLLFYTYKVDDNSFFILSHSNEGLSYYHADRKKASEKDTKIRCAMDEMNRFKSLVELYKKKQEEQSDEKQKIFDSQTKSVIADFVKNYKPQKTDAALEKGILLWLKTNPDIIAINPTPRIYLMQPNYEITRNE